MESGARRGPEQGPRSAAAALRDQLPEEGGHGIRDVHASHTSLGRLDGTSPTEAAGDP